MSLLYKSAAKSNENLHFCVNITGPNTRRLLLNSYWPQRKDFTLLLKVAAKSGKYLGASDVKITHQDGVTVFECTTDGPWLLVDLPEG